MYKLILVLLLTCSVCGQSTNVWHGITPLVSTRNDVETVLGKPELLGRSKYLLLYKTTDGKVFVYYSSGPCALNAKVGWNVPEDTVVRISFDPTVFPRVDDLKIDRTRFKVHPDPEILNSAYYTNETDGVVLTVDTSDNTVTNFSYFPESKYDHLRCKNVGPASP